MGQEGALKKGLDSQPGAHEHTENGLQSDSLDKLEIKRIVRRLDSLPSVPAVATEILNVFSKDDPDLDKVIKLIEADQGITMKLLKLVNSAYFGFRNPVTSVSRAVALLGLSQLRSVLLSVTVSESLIKPLKRKSIKEQEDLWKHSLGTAVWAELLAEEVDPTLKTDAFVGGLLHDVGKLILDECLPEKYALVRKRSTERHEPWILPEREILGIDHTTVGKWLAVKWNLPRPLIEAIWLHHHPISALEDLDFVVSRELIAIVHLSNILAHQIMLDSVPSPHASPEVKEALEFIHVKPEKLEKLKVSVGKRYSERVTVLDIKQQDEIAFYFEALQRANQKLAELASKNAQYAAIERLNQNLRMLHRLHLELSGEDDVDDVLERVAQELAKDLGEREGVIYYLSKKENKLMGRYWSPEVRVQAFRTGLDEDLNLGKAQIPQLKDQVNKLINTCHARFMDISEDNDSLFRLQYCKPFLIVPMVREAHLLGEILLYKEGPKEAETLTPSILEMYKYLASIAAASLWRIELVNETEDTADSLIRALSKNGELLQQLSRSKKKFEDLFEYSNDAIVLHDTDGNILRVNQKTTELLGYKAEELEKKPIGVLFPSDLAEVVMSSLREGWESSHGARFETQVKTKENTRLDVEISSRLVDREDNLVQSIIRDISHQKEASRALEAEKERLSVMLKSIAEGVIATNAEGDVVLLNDAAERLLGMREGEAVGKPVREIFSVVDQHTRQVNEDLTESVLRERKPLNTPENSLLLSRDGKERIIYGTGSPILSEEGEFIGSIIVFRDITKSKKIEEEFLKTQRLESIGTLAGGIAHDFNNTLTAILGNISLAKIYTKPGDTIYRVLSEAEKASMQAKDLTQQLLTFSMGGAPIKKPTSITDLLKDSVDFCLRGSNIRCDYFISDELWAVNVDESQISQVINNLIINAMQAMPDGGVISVSGKNEEISERNNQPLKPGRYVKISIQDQGVGIGEENLAKIFEPYFTTKERGCGLGLATSYSIIKKHGGHITVESKSGIGTTFHIYLPATDRPVAFKEEGKSEPIFGAGKVLVMDDDEDVRAVLCMMLGELGYQVHLVKDGQEALRIYVQEKEAGRPFDLVIMDLTIQGGMGGAEAIKRLLKIDPDARAIVSSGYYNDPIMAHYREYGFKGVITKPYSVEELSVVVKQAIDETS